MQHSSDIIFFLGLLFFGISACSPRQDKPQLPANQPDITGRITQLTTNGKLRITVEADPTDSTTTAKAIVLISAEAQTVERDGTDLHTIKSDALKEGDSVSVWFDGPVLMSYPMQAGAKTVVLEK